MVDDLNLKVVAEKQRAESPNLFHNPENEEESQYMTINELLYSTRRPTAESAEYPRLVLPKEYRDKIIWRAHKEVGHMATLKTLNRVRESYFWPGMRQDIRHTLAKCTTCIAHSRNRDKTIMGEMPVPVSPMQMVSIDLCGPFVTSKQGNKYVMNVICHHTGWAESYCIPDKTSDTIWRTFSNYFIPDHGVVEVLLSDNGKEFTAKPFTDYLDKLGIDHRRSTPLHPQSQGRIERFNRTFKEMLTKRINNQPESWEDHVGDALFAHRISVSSVTGYSPYYLMYGRQPRVPLTRLLQASTKASHFGNRLDNLAEAFSNTQQNTRDVRQANRDRINKKANAKAIEVGDTVVLLVPEPVTFSSKWEPQWQVTRVSGLTCHLRNQVTGKIKKVHRDQVKLVDPELVWDELPPRPKRQRRRPAWDAPLSTTIGHQNKNLGTQTPPDDNHSLHNNNDNTVPQVNLDDYDIVHMDDPALQREVSPDSDNESNTSVTPQATLHGPDTRQTDKLNTSINDQTNPTDQLAIDQSQNRQTDTKRARSPSPDTSSQANRGNGRLRPIKRLRYDNILNATDFLDDVLPGSSC